MQLAGDDDDWPLARRFTRSWKHRSYCDLLAIDSQPPAYSSCRRCSQQVLGPRSHPRARLRRRLPYHTRTEGWKPYCGSAQCPLYHPYVSDGIDEIELNCKRGRLPTPERVAEGLYVRPNGWELYTISRQRIFSPVVTIFGGKWAFSSLLHFYPALVHAWRYETWESFVPFGIEAAEAKARRGRVKIIESFILSVWSVYSPLNGRM